MLYTNLNTYAISPSDAAHFAVSATLAQATSRLVNKVSPDDKWAQFFIPIVAVGFVGFVYEWAQYQDMQGYSDVDRDMGINLMGAVFGASIAISLD